MQLEQTERGVWVFVEHRKGEIAGVVLELLNEGRRLAKQLGEPLACILLGSSVVHLSSDLMEYGADEVYVADVPEFDTYRDDLYADALEYLIETYRPKIVLIGGTSNGRSLAPRVATKLKTGLTADCTEFDLDDEGNLLQTRPAFGGNLMATIRCPKHRPQMATVRPKVFTEAKRETGRAGKEILVELPELNPWMEILEVVDEDAVGPNLAEADIVVAGGRGVGGPENFQLVEELAKALGGAVAASRAVVDAGWINYSHQVGQTGRTVAPKLYVACGISGAIQHLVGMQSAETIVAINQDPDAPIFSIATYGLVGDVKEIIPALIKAIKS
ncbi:MAG: electron transfer flavoprotein subunit alpha/FixB family protein [Firmicutes bacterium]|nr:electron transfer flavoprotein subunit alpha/FixB family protein [Bacillota bacterium]